MRDESDVEGEKEEDGSEGSDDGSKSSETECVTTGSDSEGQERRGICLLRRLVVCYRGTKYPPGITPTRSLW